MQRIETINERMLRTQSYRTTALNVAAKQLVDRLLGCWQHDLSRPFTNNGKSYRVCLKCGQTRNFDLETWQTSSASSHRN